MVNKSFPISFVYRLDQDNISIDLQADVEIQNDSSCYIVRNIRSLQHGGSAIPPVKLKKTASAWVHIDSLKPTDLTLSIGKAIDALDLTPPAPSEYSANETEQNAPSNPFDYSRSHTPSA